MAKKRRKRGEPGAGIGHMDGAMRPAREDSRAEKARKARRREKARGWD
jgi:hypothetical protein